MFRHVVLLNRGLVYSNALVGNVVVGEWDRGHQHVLQHEHPVCNDQQY